MAEPDAADRRWYAEVTRYQWLVLVIASAGWVFDAFEGQIFNITRGTDAADLLGSEGSPERAGCGATCCSPSSCSAARSAGSCSAPRRPLRPQADAGVTILFYSVFSGLTYFATEMWHVAALRFLVALGVGGEWAVAAALVAEVFPARAGRARRDLPRDQRARHLAGGAAGLVVGSQWRYAYLIGVLPALLVLWVRTSIQEPERWQRAGERAQAARQLPRPVRRRALAQAGDLRHAARRRRPRHVLGRHRRGPGSHARALCATACRRTQAAERAKFAYGIVQRPGAGSACSASARSPSGSAGEARSR